jgi:predicted nucleic acid-binding protein
MSRVFVDTSALLALLVPSDRQHKAAARRFEALATSRAELVTSSYVLAEVYALLGRRFGAGAIRQFRALFAPLLSTVWVDEGLHERGLDRLLARYKRRLSLVDAVSLEILDQCRIDEVFAFDKHLS